MRFLKSNRINNRTDAELIAEYKRTGDNQAVEILFDRYSHLVYALCMKYLKNEEESRDAVINIFEKLMVSLRKYEIKNFTTWIHSVARNYCFALLQNSKTKMNLLYTPLNEETNLQLADTASGDEEQVRIVETGKLTQAMESLNTEQKVCVELFYLKKFCYADITRATGYSLNQVKSYIQNGKRNLKIHLTKGND